VKKGTKNIEQKQQIADAEAIINYLTLCTSILVFTLLEDNYNTNLSEGSLKPPTLQTLSLAAASRVHPFCNLQSRARTHAVLVIGLHELLDPTT
jgi:hypothetical protein